MKSSSESTNVRLASRSSVFCSGLLTIEPHGGAREAPYAVHLTLRFSAEVFPLFATSSYWTC
jgi:hypothetical protein